MKRVGLMQPYLFPYVGYFQLIGAVDEYVFYDDAQFIKGGWINRNNILVNGSKHLFTIQLAGASANKRINEIEIADDFVKFQKTLRMAYGKAPQFDVVMQLIAEICAFENRNLARFTGNSIERIVHYLGVAPTFRYSSELPKDENLKSQDKVLDICRRLNADVYVNAIGGQELYDRSAFESLGMQLKFLRSKSTIYPQLGNEFVPWLSIIDVMMFNSSEQLKQVLGEYELV